MFLGPLPVLHREDRQVREDKDAQEGGHEGDQDAEEGGHEGDQDAQEGGHEGDQGAREGGQEGREEPDRRHHAADGHSYFHEILFSLLNMLYYLNS